MRITHEIMMRSLLKNLNMNVSKMDYYNNQLSSGRKVTRPSDDPAGTAMQMRLYSENRRIQQYMENADAGVTWLENTDVALDEVNKVLTRLNELAVQGANGTLAQDSRDAIAKEVGELADHLVQVGNSKIGARYIFGGTRSLKAPFETVIDANGQMTSVQYVGDDGEMKYEVGSGVDVVVNIPGDKAFSSAIQAAIDLRDRLLAGDTAAVSSDSIKQIQDSAVEVLEWRANVGAKINRMELTKDRLSAMEVNSSRLLSSVEDVDYAETITNLKMQEMVYQASLSMGAKIIQPTLLDFLR